MKKLLLLLSFLLVAGFLSACEDTADFADMAETDPIEPMNEEPGGGETAVSSLAYLNQISRLLLLFLRFCCGAF